MNNAYGTLLVSASLVSAARGEPARGSIGWEAVITAPRLETDPMRLCGALDGPALPAWDAEESMRLCYQAFEDQASHGRATRKAASKPDKAEEDLFRSIDGAVDSCLSGVQSSPYKFVLFEASKACAIYDRYIGHYTSLLQSGQAPSDPSIIPRFQTELAVVQKRKAECQARTTAPIKLSHASRDRAATTLPLVDILAIPSAARLPSEVERVKAEKAACFAEADRRRTERTASAAIRSLDEIREIPFEYWVAAERDRSASAYAAEHDHNASADAAYEVLVNKRRSDPKWIGPVLSASICNGVTRKAAAAKEIQMQQAYARRYGGVVNPYRIDVLLQQIRLMDDTIAELRVELRRMGAAAQGCQLTLIRQIAACLLTKDNEGVETSLCRGKRILEYLALVN